MITVDQSIQYSEKSHGPSNRTFGFVVSTLLFLISGYKYYRTGEANSLLVGIAVFLVASALFYPPLITYPKKIWLAITGKIAVLVNLLLTMILFYLVITPVAVFLRMIGRDELGVRIDRTKKSYWNVRQNPGACTETPF